ncbi:hypothetical protein ACTNA4_15285 [Bariatricus sp. HCP28S3_A7]|uniref:hypothetical protein n=1 Tax=Bariatricus sp. HCP28S3_A7 TaxID=3438894 RepID=UPI003F8BAA53
MFLNEDTTYNDIRERSLLQWLDEMERHEDVAVRGGVKLCREYIQYLKQKNVKLEEENELKSTYLKKYSKRNL